MSEATYYLRTVKVDLSESELYTSATGISMTWTIEQGLTAMGLDATEHADGSVGLLNDKDRTEGTNEYHIFADASLSEPSFALEDEDAGDTYSNATLITYDSTEETSLKDKFGGNENSYSLTEATGLVNTYIDGIVAQALLGTAYDTQFMSHEIIYTNIIGELSTLGPIGTETEEAIEESLAASAATSPRGGGY